MANNVVHTTLVRTALADLVVDLIDAGAGAGKLLIVTGADVEVANIPFADPAFGAAAAGVATCLGVPIEDTNATGHANPVDAFIIKDSNDLEVLRGTVGVTAGGFDIELSSLTIGATDTVSITALTYTAPQ